MMHPEQSIDPAIVGYWFGGFIITMFFTAILLFFAGRRARANSGGNGLRVAAVAISLLLTYFSHSSSGIVNIGNVAAIVLTCALAYRQHKRASA